jgi:phosphate transport system substrate-binding protein
MKRTAARCEEQFVAPAIVRSTCDVYTTNPPNLFMKTHCLTLLIGLATITSNAQAETLVIKGSNTLGAKLVPQLAEEFKAQQPGTTFSIAAEGSTTGIAPIIDGTAQIGMSSRPTKPEEVAVAGLKGVNFKQTTVAYDGIAVIVNSANPVKSLTRMQVEQIFTGDTPDWSAVGGSAGKISVYTRNSSSGTYAEFKELAMKRHDYAPDAQKMADNEQIVAAVSKDPNGIGYIGLAYTKASGTKVLEIDGTTLSKESVLSKTYPYSRPTFYYTNGEPTGLAKQFVDFTLSNAGQKIVEQVGFVPVK